MIAKMGYPPAHPKIRDERGTVWIPVIEFFRFLIGPPARLPRNRGETAYHPQKIPRHLADNFIETRILKMK